MDPPVAFIGCPGVGTLVPVAIVYVDEDLCEIRE